MPREEDRSQEHQSCPWGSWTSHTRPVPVRVTVLAKAAGSLSDSAPWGWTRLQKEDGICLAKPTRDTSLSWKALISWTAWRAHYERCNSMKNKKKRKLSRWLPFPNTSWTGTFHPKAKILAVLHNTIQAKPRSSSGQETARSSNVKYVGVVPAPTMAFSLPSAYIPCSFTSRGFIFSPCSNAVDKKPLLFFSSAEAWTCVHLSLQGQTHLPGRKKAGSRPESTAGLALGHTSQR